MLDWWVGGHFIGADSAAGALDACRNLYDYAPKSVRPWTLADWDYCVPNWSSEKKNTLDIPNPKRCGYV